MTTIGQPLSSAEKSRLQVDRLFGYCWILQVQQRISRTPVTL